MGRKRADAGVNAGGGWWGCQHCGGYELRSREKGGKLTWFFGLGKDADVKKFSFFLFFSPILFSGILCTLLEIELGLELHRYRTSWGEYVLMVCTFKYVREVFCLD